MLFGIDVSSHQGNINTGGMFDNSKIDFVIAKATEGCTYVNPYCDAVIQSAIKRNKPCGVYHFARSNDAKAEARHFVNNCKGYIGHAIPILDYEADALHNGVSWALTWLKEVERLWGVKPMIYMSQSVTKAYNWQSVVDNDNGLWMAQYNSSPSDPGYWHVLAMWQYTSTGHVSGYSGNLDCNYFYGDVSAWNKYAKINATGGGAVDSGSSSSSDALPVDGKCGVKTVKLWQEVLGCDVCDGVISNQFSAYKSILKGIMNNAIQYENNPRPHYSPFIKAVQQRIGATPDGWVGPNFVRKLQQYMGTGVDGELWNPSDCIKAVQRRLNEGWF